MERWRRLDSDLMVGIVLLVLCAAIAPVVIALPSDGVVAGAPGSRLFPLGLLSILAGLSAVLALGGLRRMLAGRAHVLPGQAGTASVAGAAGTAGAGSVFDRVTVRVGATVGAVVVYVYLMAGMRGWLRSIGILVPRGYAFTALTAVFLTGFYFLGSRRLGRSTLVASSVALVLYVGFVAILNVRFP